MWKQCSWSGMEVQTEWGIHVLVCCLLSGFWAYTAPCFLGLHLWGLQSASGLPQHLWVTLGSWPYFSLA